MVFRKLEEHRAKLDDLYVNELKKTGPLEERCRQLRYGCPSGQTLQFTIIQICLTNAHIRTPNPCIFLSLSIFIYHRQQEIKKYDSKSIMSVISKKCLKNEPESFVSFAAIILFQGQMPRTQFRIRIRFLKKLGSGTLLGVRKLPELDPNPSKTCGNFHQYLCTKLN